MYEIKYCMICKKEITPDDEISENVKNPIIGSLWSGVGDAHTRCYKPRRKIQIIARTINIVFVVVIVLVIILILLIR